MEEKSALASPVEDNSNGGASDVRPVLLIGDPRRLRRIGTVLLFRTDARLSAPRLDAAVPQPATLRPSCLHRHAAAERIASHRIVSYLRLLSAVRLWCKDPRILLLAPTQMAFGFSAALLGSVRVARTACGYL